jgi:hypothetical protein
METQNRTHKSELDPNWAYRGRAFGTILRMGHCAPAVMQTLLDISSTEKEWLVKLSAGMPGGIGNTGFECGAFTSPLALLGMRYGLREVDRDLPVIFDKGFALCHNFLACQHTLQCREIRGKDRFPLHCIPPVARSPELYLNALEGNHHEPIPAATREAYSRLYSHMVEHNFHCAQTTLMGLGFSPLENQLLFDTASAFMGGTLLMGRTCSAFTSGVMVIGLKLGEIEDSYLRVIRMLAIMTAGGNAFDERINKFNRSMNIGYRLSKWFVKEFGSTQCQAMTQCDFSNQAGVGNYISAGCITSCEERVGKVAEKVQAMLGKASDTVN